MSVGCSGFYYKAFVGAYGILAVGIANSCNDLYFSR